MQQADTRYWWTSSCGLIELHLSLEEANMGYHPGHCDADIDYLSGTDSLASQLKQIDPEDLAKELQGYGAWDAEELKDHPANIQRILWIAAGDLVDTPEEELEAA